MFLRQPAEVPSWRLTAKDAKRRKLVKGKNGGQVWQKRAPKPRKSLVLVDTAAAQAGVEPICLYCQSFRGDYCAKTEEVQTPHGTCRQWEAST